MNFWPDVAIDWWYVNWMFFEVVFMVTGPGSREGSRSETASVLEVLITIFLLLLMLWFGSND